MAALVRYDPVFDMLRPTSLWEREFDEFFSPLMLRPAALLDDWFVRPSVFAGMGNLPLDIYETDDALIVEATVPGVDADQIEIEERNGMLTIRARMAEEKEEERSGWYLRERRMGMLQRTIPLPVAVKGEKANAELKNGILRITLPKEHKDENLINRIKVSVPKIKLPKLSVGKGGRKETGVKVKAA
ncbi:MAG: Hsp20/alpha crystallin family protein [Chloroflexi bacterium]|nr:Hsp20/alpha crystallin family protein [Chloroflexota bacterium]